MASGYTILLHWCDVI